MHSAYEVELIKATEAMRAALDEILRLVRNGKAFGHEWDAASDQHDEAVRKWRTLIDKPLSATQWRPATLNLHRSAVSIVKTFK
jgi:hypothetical protein